MIQIFLGLTYAEERSRRVPGLTHDTFWLAFYLHKLKGHHVKMLGIEPLLREKNTPSRVFSRGMKRREMEYCETKHCSHLTPTAASIDDERIVQRG